MLRIVKSFMLINSRNYKNFGHKRQPEARVTVLWHGFLTFSFIGLGLNWKRIGNFLLGESTDDTEASPIDM